MPNPTRLIKIGKSAERFKRIAKAVEAVPQELKVPHPLNPDEVYTFPPGTDPTVAKEFVRRMALEKARRGEEKIEMASELPAERIKELEVAEKELERAKAMIADLESRKDLTRVEPGTYLDENTGKYYRVTSKGLIEELVVK